jgi:hypothetical protein
MDTRRGSSSWADEALVLRRPASTYRRLGGDANAVASWWRRPTLLAVVLGCSVSMAATGRFTPRLIADGAIAFLFVPAFAWLAFALVFRRSRHAFGFRQAADLFFLGHSPWLLWLVLLIAVTASVPPRRLSPFILPLLVSMLVPAVWGLWLDFHFFREVLQRTPREARRDVLLHRALAWTAVTVYFLGIAIAGEELPAIAEWLHR